MKDYKNLLKSQLVLTEGAERLVDEVLRGDMSIRSLHNKKAYAKRVGAFTRVLQCTIALEILRGL